MTRERCTHAWSQVWTTILDRPTPVARWVCDRCGDATDTDPTPVPGTPPTRGGALTFGGSGSWSFRVSSGEALDAALWVRDAFGLPVPAGPAVPPPLTRPPARRPWPDDARTAAAAWWMWWSASVEGDADGTVPAPAVFAPWWDEACDAVRPVSAAAARREAFPQQVLHRVVDDVVFDRDVAPGDLHGTVVLLAVTGTWWHLVAPGRALAAEGVVASGPAAHGLLDAVLRSAAA